MGGWRRSVATLAGVGAVLIASAACAPKVASTGQKLADPSQPLETALAKLKKDNYAGIQNNSITVSSDTECFYSLAGKDAKGISDRAVCGPIRRLGLSSDQVWDSYRLSFSSDSDGNAVATVGARIAQGVSTDTDLLVSPDGDKPSSGSDLPAPKAPQTSVMNRAVAVADDATPAGLTFSPLAHPAKLITPAATITVTGTAPVTNVPDALVAGQNDPAGKAAYYLPASGQKLYAYQLQISAPPALPASTARSTETVASTSLKLKVGDTSIPIGDHTSTGGSSSWSFRCMPSGSASYPCKPQTTKITILMTAPASGAVALTATSDDADQTVDLATGAVTSNVSTVEYDRSRLTTKINKRLKTDPYQLRLQTQPTSQTSPTPTNEPSASADPDDPSKKKDQQDKKPKIITAEASWSMKIDSVSLTAYDPTLGWAPKDQAWMIISTSNYRQHEDGASFSTHRAASLSLNSDDVGHPVKSPTDEELGADPGDDVNWAFAVPDDATSATVAFRPTGTATADGVSSSFTSDQVATLQLDLAR